MDASDSNIARDAYSSNDPYASKNPYGGRDPYANKSPYDKDGNTDEKIPSIYGYGKYCDHFFEVENLFRTKFTDDTQLHSEKRVYVGSGDLAAVIPKMSRITASSFSIVLLTVFTSLASMFFVDSQYTIFVSMAVITLVFLWRFACPSYLMYNSRQYIMGEEYKGLYKSFMFFMNFMEMMNIAFSALFLFYSSEKIKSISYILTATTDYLKENSPVFKGYFSSLSDRINGDMFSNIQYVAILYVTLVVAYHVYYFYFNRVIVEKRRRENIKSTKLKRLSNLYQRKAYILNGENLD